MITPGIAFFSLGANARLAVAPPAIVVTCWVATALLVAGGLLPDVGLVRSADLAPTPRLFFLLMVPLVIGVTRLEGVSGPERRRGHRRPPLQGW